MSMTLTPTNNENRRKKLFLSDITMVAQGKLCSWWAKILTLHGLTKNIRKRHFQTLIRYLSSLWDK